MKHEDEKRSRYMDKKTEGMYTWLLKYVALVVVLFFAALITARMVDADDELAIMDLLPEGDGLVIGTVGDDYVVLQKIGDQVVGNVGDKRVYLHEIEAGDWKMTTGHIGDDAVNINEWDWETDDDG